MAMLSAFIWVGESKYIKIVEEEDSLFRCLDDRLNTINLIDINSSNNKKTEEDKTEKDLNGNNLNNEGKLFKNLKKFLDKKFPNLLLDFFLKEKYLDTAKNFIEEENIKVRFFVLNNKK